MSNDIINVNNLNFKYSQQGDWLFKDFNFKIERHEWVAVIGHNGSGKSTLARLIDGLLQPQSGSIMVDQQTMSAENVWKIRKKIGMVFQNPENQFVGANVAEDVAFGLENQAVPYKLMHQRVKTALQRVNMWRFAEQEPVNLSGGQKQRVALAGVIALQPEIIILDEATSMLDPEGRRDVIQLIHDLKVQHNFTIISITHDIDEAALADRVIVLDDGKIIESAPPAQVFLHGKELSHLGLAVPFSEKVKAALVKRRITVPVQYYTEQRMVDWICQSISNK
ncbi:energy-coupling factor ABC transporter ATP-binding protein [Liquorilactobacillus nagelii]|uniref:energy-coupling factor ABC transporter ATP-binding protein n=1 Tax=Liquorilactobacillus nagelii TaxID=82688 RepID=UPI0006EF9CD1|nr:energy-coupling factor ABC transporter ATP-binding protein [Liquorilactobacillus nagelii]KRL40375.1 cobalt import atp-binding protein cbio 2 [Liquorilactobacillus nagelii DSM 13675]QYH54732.1 energy-coupling factor ABC transporter ATP-binding protein [Liquorilactobacillus nagelii DSM 13675]